MSNSPEQNFKRKLEKLARSGTDEPAPCCDCGKPTTSHVVVNYGSGWEEISEDVQEELLDITVSSKLAVICHTCFIDMDEDWEPDKDDWRDV